MQVVSSQAKFGWEKSRHAATEHLADKRVDPQFKYKCHPALIHPLLLTRAVGKSFSDSNTAVFTSTAFLDHQRLLRHQVEHLHFHLDYSQSYQKIRRVEEDLADPEGHRRTFVVVVVEVSDLPKWAAKSCPKSRDAHHHRS
jgi:hypothetical protein